MDILENDLMEIILVIKVSRNHNLILKPILIETLEQFLGFLFWFNLAIHSLY